MWNKRKLQILIILLMFNVAAKSQNTPKVIAFASDTQEPMWIEKLFLKSNNNLLATKMIFDDIKKVRPASLFLLGDVVSSGKQTKAWSNIDRYLNQLRKDSISVYATTGNHDLMFNAKKGAKNFLQRFPSYRSTGYAQVVDSVAVILLNSNFNTLNDDEIAKQNTWYSKQMQDYDQDPAIKFIIVGCHHSPYTNSRIVNPSILVQQYFVPPFIKSAKAVLFLSGHSHNFEHFKIKEKNFFVIGGGGGLHQPLNNKAGKMNDLSEDYKPAYHYILITRDKEDIQFVSRFLKSDFSAFQDGLKFRAAKVKGNN